MNTIICCVCNREAVVRTKRSVVCESIVCRNKYKKIRKEQKGSGFSFCEEVRINHENLIQQHIDRIAKIKESLCHEGLRINSPFVLCEKVISRG